MKSLIFCNGAISNTGTNRAPPGFANGPWQSGAVSTIPSCPAPSAGTIDGLTVLMSAAPGAGLSWAFTLVVNGVDTALTCTVADSNTTASDTGHSVSISAGDLITMKAVSSGAVSVPVQASFCLRFNSTTAKEQNLLGGSRVDNLATSGTEYIGFENLAPNGTETLRRGICGTSGTIKNLYIKLNTAPGAGTSRTFTVVKNGVDTALVVTVADAATTGNDTTHSFTVAAGDEISIKSTVSGTPAASMVGVGATFLADTDGESLVFGLSSGTSFSNSATQYNCVTGTVPFTTESTYRIPSFACVVKKLYAAVNTAPGASKSITFDIRVNSASPANNPSAQITGAATTTGNDTTNTATVVDGDLLDMRNVPAGTPTVSAFRYGFVAYIAPAAAANGNMLMFF